MASPESALFYFLNRTIASPTMDTIVEIFTNVHYWYAIYALFAIYVIYRYKMEGVRLVIAALLLVAFTDSLGHYVLKPWIARPRPCSTVAGGGYLVDWIRLPDGPRQDPSFPSSHALNNFAVATFFALCYPQRKMARWLIAIATIISLGRVYEGVHYPSDIVGGGLIGMFCAIGFAMAYNYIDERRRGITPLPNEKVELTEEDTGAIDMAGRAETKRLWLEKDKPKT